MARRLSYNTPIPGEGMHDWRTLEQIERILLDLSDRWEGTSYTARAGDEMDGLWAESRLADLRPHFHPEFEITFISMVVSEGPADVDYPYLVVSYSRGDAVIGVHQVALDFARETVDEILAVTGPYVPPEETAAARWQRRGQWVKRHAESIVVGVVVGVISGLLVWWLVGA